MGSIAPDFKVYDANGKAFSLSDFRGKLVYVDVWATWCVPCLQELPHLKKLKDAYRNNKNIVFMGVSLDRPQDKEKWKKMVGDKNMEGPQFLAEGELKSDIAKGYQIRAIPTFLLISRDGKIISSQAPRPSEGKRIRKLIEDNLQI